MHEKVPEDVPSFEAQKPDRGFCFRELASDKLLHHHVQGQCCVCCSFSTPTPLLRRRLQQRPDVTIINEEDREVLIAEEVAFVPFDAFIDISYDQKKFEKYIELFCREITALGLSLPSNCHRDRQPRHCPQASCSWPATSLESPATTLRSGFARYLSVSAVLGSHAVWQRRCSDLQRKPATSLTV